MYHRKKDYLMNLLEQLLKHMSLLIDKQPKDPLQTAQALENSFAFYKDNFGVQQSDSVKEILEKLPAIYFIDEYAKLLVFDYNLSGNPKKESLEKALELLNYLQYADKTYSWDREALKQDILRLLEHK